MTMRFRSNAPFKIGITYLWIAATLLYMHQYCHRVMISTLSQDIIQSFNITMSDVGNMVSAYIYAYLLSVLLTIPLLRYLGRANLLITAIVLDQIGLMMMYFANSAIHIFGALLVLGFSGASAITLALSFVKELNLKKNAAILNGLTFCMGMVGVFVGTVVVRKIDLYFGWQLTILHLSIFNVAALICYLLGASRYKQYSQQPQKNSSMSEIALSPFKLWQYWGANLYVSLQMLPSVAFVIVWLVPFTGLVIINNQAIANIAPDIVLGGLTAGFFIYPVLLNKGFQHRMLMAGASIVGMLTSYKVLFNAADEFWYSINLFLMGIALAAYMVATTYVQSFTSEQALPRALPIHIISVNLFGVIALNIINDQINYDINMLQQNLSTAFHHVFIIIPICFFAAAMLALTLTATSEP